jgi:hypothetical protein
MSINMADNNNVAAPATTEVQHVDIEASNPRRNRLKEVYAHPWTQIIAISVICFCCPGVS